MDILSKLPKAIAASISLLAASLEASHLETMEATNTSGAGI